MGAAPGSHPIPAETQGQGEVAQGAELRPCLWGRRWHPVLLLWGQHPYLLLVTMGRNWPSINTLAASQPRGPAFRPFPGWG